MGKSHQNQQPRYKPPLNQRFGGQQDSGGFKPTLIVTTNYVDDGFHSEGTRTTPQP
jgi:hypothetical protein